MELVTYNYNIEKLAKFQLDVSKLKELCFPIQAHGYPLNSIHGGVSVDTRLGYQPHAIYVT